MPLCASFGLRFDQMYQSRYGDAGSDRADWNHGCSRDDGSHGGGVKTARRGVNGNAARPGVRELDAGLSGRLQPG